MSDLPPGWHWDDGRKGGGYAASITTDLWPHGGLPGDVRYIKMAAASGWAWLVVDEGHPGTHLQQVTLQQTLDRFPEIRDLILHIHQQVEQSTFEIAMRWTDRRMRYRAERLAATRRAEP